MIARRGFDRPPERRFTLKRILPSLPPLARPIHERVESRFSARRSVVYVALLCLVASSVPSSARRAPRQPDTKASSVAAPTTPAPPTPLTRQYSFGVYQLRYGAPPLEAVAASSTVATTGASPATASSATASSATASSATASSATASSATASPATAVTTTRYISRNPDGSSALTHLPLEGPGPWLDSARSQTHRESFAAMARVGINAALIQYPADVASRAEWGRTGADMAAQGIREITAAGQSPPSIALFLDFLTPTRWDLSAGTGRSALFAVIREFYHRIPANYRTMVSLPDSPDLPNAIPVFLGAPQGMKGISPEFVTDLRARFQREFGLPVALAGDLGWKAAAPTMDAYFSLEPEKPLTLEESAPIHTAVLSPSYNERGMIPDEPIRARLSGRPFVAAWNDVGEKKPDWTILNSWNGWRYGTELAPSREAGDRDLNLTRAALAHLDSDAPYRARLLSESVPPAVQAGSLTRMEFRVENAGVQPWPEGAYLRSEWTQNGAVIASGSVSLPNTIRPREQHTAGILVAARKGPDPLPDGDYQLRFILQVLPQAEVPGGGVSFGAYPVHVGGRPPLAARLLSSDLPLLMRPGPVYRARARIRNEGASPWIHLDAAVSYRWRRVWDITSAVTEADLVPTDPTVALRTPLKVDVPSGSLADLTVDVSALGKGNQPLDAWTPGLPWHYELEWIITNSAGEALTHAPETVELLPNDVAADFPLGLGLPSQVEADTSTDMKIVVKNIGAETWKKGDVSVGFRWYYYDGVPMNSESNRVPVVGPLGDLAPGQQTLVRVPVQSPPFAGLFLLAAEVFRNGRWASETPVTRGTVALAQPLTVKGGGFEPLDLVALLKTSGVDGVSPDSLPGDGDFDGQGNTFPGQFMPPLVTPQEVRSDLYPNGYLGPVIGVGLDANRRVPFRYPPKADGAVNMVSNTGQDITLRVPRPTAIHLLMAADEDRDAEWLLTYADGSKQRQHLSLSSWDKPPTFDSETIGYFTPVRNSKNGVERTPAYLKHYIIPCDSKKPLQQLDLPTDPHIKLVAMTVETW